MLIAGALLELTAKHGSDDYVILYPGTLLLVIDRDQSHRTRCFVAGQTLQLYLALSGEGWTMRTTRR
jgi:hypothetical protein